MVSRNPVKIALKEAAGEVDAFLETCFNGQDFPDRLCQSMEYSLLAGGKRLRPVLCLSWAGLVGGDKSKIVPFACGIECIHTYSLIHDDLPAMDNDDLRRGRPSNHRKFDEATAILAGDGLLTEAFTLMLSTPLDPGLVSSAAREFSLAAGPRGMVGGQMLDMLFTGRTGVPLEELRDMHARKTGALIAASCKTGAILAGGDDHALNRAEKYGRAIGLAFQVVDDILDVIGDEKDLGKPVGSDQGKGKTTYPALIGLEKSYDLAQKSVDRAVEVLEGFHSNEAVFLRDLARYIVERAQ